MDYLSVLNMDPYEMIHWITEEFSIDIPPEITTIEDMDEAARLLLKISGMYSYLCTLLSYAKIETRNKKRSGDKIAYEDMVDRKEIIQNMVDVVKQQYAAVSRSVTIRMENNRELQMVAGGYING